MNNRFGFTPEPWYATSMSGHQGLVATEKDGKSVALTYDKADTLAVAAVPELVDALETIGNYMVHDDGTYVIQAEDMQKVRAALALLTP